jgi:tetratricopeptide (TPR) repeat protein
MPNDSAIDKYLEEGLNLYGLGKFKEAIECWKKVLELDPDNSLAKDYIESAGGEVSKAEKSPPERLEETPKIIPPLTSPPSPGPEREAKMAPPPPKPEEAAKVAPSPPSPPPPEADREAKINQAKGLFKEGQFELAMEMFESILSEEPDNLDVQGYYEMARNQQLKHYKSEVGELSQIPRVLKEASEIRKLNLDHEQGFILSLIDGRISYDDVFSLSNMDGFKTYRIIYQLLCQGIIGV